MRRTPIQALLGPALVLYLIADAASSQGELDPAGALVALVAAALSLSRLRLGRDADLPGAKTAGWMGLWAGLSLVRLAAPQALSLPLDLVHAVATAAFAALLLELALTVPDRVGPSGRRPRLALRVVAASMGALGLAAHAPALQLFGVAALAPAAWAHAPLAYLALVVAVALGLRLSRRRMGSSPEALASNTWAVFGLLPAAAFAAGAGLALLFGVSTAVPVLRVGAGLVVAVLIWSHLRLVDPARRLSVGPTTRDAVAASTTLAMVVAAAVSLRELWPVGPLPMAAAVAGTLLLAAACYRGLRELARTSLAPFGGRLLQALEEGHRELARTRDMPGLASIVLATLRRASADPGSEPVLFVFDPEVTLRIDAAGQPHAEREPPHPELTRVLQEHPGDVVLRAPLQAQLVRNPPLRPLIDALVTLDALAVVPVALDGQLEGALVVPRGRRPGTPNLEEIEAMHGFARHVAGYLSVLTAEARAQQRTGSLLHGQRRAEAEAERLGSELELANAGARALMAGGSLERLDAPELAYGPTMRSLRERLRAVAKLDAPLLLVAEQGTALLPLARGLHAAGGRADGPFVLGACAEVVPERSERALFGEPPPRWEKDGGLEVDVEADPHAPANPGWATLAEGGVLLLTDLPALLGSAQERLASALEGLGDEVLGTRLVATVRRDPKALAEAGALRPELLERFPLVLRVPPLRERPEDLPSLILLAIDRACRVQGRETVGIAPGAQERLCEYEWPGNQRELEAVVEQAVARCSGTRIALEDLPAFGAAQARAAGGHPLEGSFEAVECRVLAHALERAEGNRSEAARLLGLKRTTFLDKLRRHGLEGAPRARSTHPAPN